MQPVKRMATDKSDAAAKAYAEARRKFEEQQQKLEQLERYRDDYRGQRGAAGGQGMDAFRLRDYNTFVARIDGAIEHQRSLVERTEAEAARRRSEWMQVLGRARAIDKVVTRYQDEERREGERREQRASDELAQRRRPRDE